MRPTYVTATANATFTAIPVNLYSEAGFNIGLAITATGDIAADVQVTLDDPNVTDTSTLNWFDCHDASLVGATGSIQGSITEPCQAIRLHVTTGGTAGSGVKLTIVQAGNA